MGDVRKHNFSEYLKLKRRREEQRTEEQSQAGTEGRAEEQAEPQEEPQTEAHTEPQTERNAATAKEHQSSAAAHENCSPVTWDDEFTVLEKKYAEGNALPPLLSPQLPSRYTDRPMIPTKLSPTLPPKYSRQVPERKPTPLSLSSASSNRRVKIVRRNHCLEVTIHLPPGLKVKAHNSVTKKQANGNSRLIGLGISTSASIDKEQCHANFEKFVRVATEKKHLGDSYRDSPGGNDRENVQLAIVTYIDSITMYLVGFHHQDMYRKLCKKLSDEKTWLTLESLLDLVITLSQHEHNDSSDITGLCYQIRCVVYEHVSRIVDGYIRVAIANRKRSFSDADKLRYGDVLVERIKQQMKYRDISRKSLERGDELLDMAQLARRYRPLLGRPSREKPVEEDRAESLFDGAVHLPINHTTTVEEVSEYAVRVAQLWSKHQGVRYTNWGLG
ncbi:uncharacterized protein CYBJADRAFT_174239 [Cyberlindnera jadinii NRRL Y-1542]|uniref:Uncharacterized protein n=1 Tax=Cyberlindnera jadinii (strain ATCC 18201 / CBS 1600 / BCRC 20928 / JCM 3617 / NBRC 0987 / NRRL Y-1542) TaxID=983966 RepID=A0A1E4RYP1_CYBJN|nr:hypothetical protein CYBJADRAFT_174239 [Cyberlindnera jadinii NRRL Y-1542]ODV72378.1 hypothetical protein CYBJADRAFT_174239 [Cyberlindnera jadinii NRRL Y-1542]